jgi:hypothetical protein
MSRNRSRMDSSPKDRQLTPTTTTPATRRRSRSRRTRTKVELLPRVAKDHAESEVDGSTRGGGPWSQARMLGEVVDRKQAGKARPWANAKSHPVRGTSSTVARRETAPPCLIVHSSPLRDDGFTATCLTQEWSAAIERWPVHRCE